MLTVLFADDELHFIEGLIEMVRAEGFIVKTCRDASTAIELTSRGGVDCLVIDVMMNPGKTLTSQDPQSAGLAAIDAILRVKPRQPIVCFSVISDGDIIRNLKSRGVLYLRKGETSGEVALKMIRAKATGIYHHE
jgi:CheY-like chemotaxis protein